MITVLGLDPGLSLGVSIQGADRAVLKTVQIEATDPMIRLQELWEKLLPLFNPVPDMVAVESYSMARRGSGTFTIGEMGGVLRLIVGAFRVPLVAIAPQSLKKFAHGKGNDAEKARVILAVFKTWGVEAKNDNEADAFILGKIAYHLVSNSNSDLLEYQKEVLDTYGKKIQRSHTRYSSGLSHVLGRSRTRKAE